MDAFKQKVKDYAAKIGIDKIGFTNADPFLNIEPALRESHALGYTTGFEHGVIEERVYPELIFDKPKAIIAIALAYPSVMKERLKNERNNRRGSFARASWGLDYHDILRDRMDRLIAFMQAEYPKANFKAMVDTGELQDTAVAERAGLGFIGRNSLLITPEFGSWVYLGEIITDLEFESDEPIPFGCGDCYRCVEACPPQAIIGDGQIKGRSCLSYQTQTKHYMPHEFRPLISSVIYGCDICQLCCPYNRGMDFHLHEEMEGRPEQMQPALKPMLTLSNREFRAEFGELAGAWRGKKPLQRNAIIALANLRDLTALPLLIKVMEEDPRPMIRGTAAWALSRIERFYNEALIRAVAEQKAKESEADTLKEFEAAIMALKEKRKRENRLV